MFRGISASRHLASNTTNNLKSRRKEALRRAAVIDRLEPRYMLDALMADLSVTKTAPATGVEGQNINYTITIANNGPNDAQGVALTDVLPAGMTFASATESSGAAFAISNPAVGSGGTITASIPTLSAGSSATFAMSFNASEEGIFANVATATSTTPDPTPANNSASATTTVTDAPLTPVGITILATEGVTFNNKVVAHFSDANPNPDVLDLSASINWGDGTSSVGTIAENGSGAFDVSGSHQYVEQAANLPVTVTIKDTGGASAIAHSAASIGDAALTPTAGKIVNATEGSQLTSVVLGGFIDADPNGVPSDYTVSINWGDGTPTSAGLVTANGPGFDVSGTHTYADEGMFLPVITVNDEGGFALGGFTTTLNAKVLVGDAALTATGIPVSAVEGQSFTFPVASFTDANPAAPLADFTATINWGDGSPTTSGVVSEPGGVGTPFTVAGTHTYGEEGSFAITTSIKDVGGSTATATSTATVADAVLTLNPATLPFLLEGASFSGPIASVFDADPAGTQSDYTVTVNWGDGTSSAGTVGAGGPFLTGSQFQINAGHTYEEEGLYSVQVCVTDAGGSKAKITEQALVIDAPLTGVGKILSGVEGASFSGAVASFTDADPHGQVGDYIATIDWGDGHIGSGLIKANGAGGFDVTGKHTYAEEGTYPIIVSVHDGGSHVDISSAITVSDPAVVATGVAPLSSVEGISTPTVTLATFTDPGGPEVLTDYSASMNWGDASSSAVSISFAAGVFTVSGSHTYSEEGNYSTLLSIHHDTAPDTSVLGSAVVSDAALSGTGKILAAVEGAAFSGPVASFTDANPVPDIADFSATIDWGDTITTAGTISPNGSGGFYVNGIHTYEEEAKNLPMVIVVKDFGGATTTINSAITIADAALSGHGVPLAGQQEGNTFSGSVAAFTDADPHGTPSDYNATINWGDGATTDGLIATDGVGGFNVQGVHIYVEEGDFTIHTSIKDVGGASTWADTHIHVNEAPISATAKSFALTQGQSFAGLVGGMIDANPFEPVGDYSVSIDWGDGSAPSAAVITPSGVPGQFSLSGSHTYVEDGDFTLSITVNDDGTLAATATGDVTVAEAQISASGNNISGIEGVTLNKTVATFSDTDIEPISDYAASIDWGDGNVTNGTIVALGGGSYAVKGAHAYGDEGLYAMSISINDDGALAATASANANISDAPLSNGVGKTFTIMEGNIFNGSVASFSDANLLAGASDFTAKITWGDGKITSGSVVKDSSGKFHVNGSHAYAEQKTYATAIQVNDVGGQSVTAHGVAHVPDAPLTAGSPLTLHLTHGVAFSGTVGNFIDQDSLNALPGDYKATINWGDAKTSKASFALTSTGHWKVLGGHTYAKKGTYHLSLTILDGGSTTTLTATVIVS
jgi:large repetitive protein